MSKKELRKIARSIILNVLAIMSLSALVRGLDRKVDWLSLCLGMSLTLLAWYLDDFIKLKNKNK